MTEQELRQLLSLGHETPGVECKASGPRTNKEGFAKVVRAVLALSNRRNGGHVVIGVEDDGGKLNLVGLNDKDLNTWSQEDVSGGVSRYADPFVTIHTSHMTVDGKSLVAIETEEFSEVPVLCKKDYPGVLRNGACYIRRRGRIESSEIPNSSEMRELLDLATEKALRRFRRLQAAETPVQNDDDLFDQEVRDLND